MNPTALQDRVDRLIGAYRLRGHLAASLDPLGRPRHARAPELDPASYGFSEQDLDVEVSTASLPGPQQRTVRSIIEHLRDTYCGAIAVELAHVDDAGARAWLQERMERTRNRVELGAKRETRILEQLTRAVVFEEFLRKKFVGSKSFSLEGAESLLPLLDHAFNEAGRDGLDEIVLGMSHRGRLNVLVNVMQVPPEQLFLGLADKYPPPRGGDVRYHLGHSADIETASGHALHLSLSFNPSHLEFVAPVVLGRTRAKQHARGDHERRRVMALIVHGDAAFAGEGVVQETLNLCRLPHYSVGGALHVIVNNQLGFTTPPEEGRSSRYATDVAKMLGTPIIHVNGEHPTAVAHAVRLAMEYRREFATDVVIDMYCVRRLGHNELDDPRFTQPLMYEQIERHGGVRENYLQRLLSHGHVTLEDAEALYKQDRADLDAALELVHEGQAKRVSEPRRGPWAAYFGGPASVADQVDTTVPAPVLRRLLCAQTAIPDGFTPHPRFETFFARRREMARDERPLDWSAAEALALSSLACDGVPIRLSGQDTVRGTFGQRHARLHDQTNGATYWPMHHLEHNQASVEVGNSPLSELGALGFEYGYSLDAPDTLTMWEAQFGDFGNTAQVVIDQFVVAAEVKWNRLSGLVLLMPHGLEGQGPEHSSARIERFLNLVAEDNLQVVAPSTPAQYFHLLRQQALRRWRKPLVCVTPKGLLRHKRCVSSIDDLAGGRFQPILPDEDVDVHRPLRVLLCSGKVYYDLVERRDEAGITDIPIVRIEQLAPLPLQQLRELLHSYQQPTSILWVQEEPSNMGAWRYLRAQLADSDLAELVLPVRRPASPSPAVGSPGVHRREQRELCDHALGIEAAAGQPDRHSVAK